MKQDSFYCMSGSNSKPHLIRGNSKESTLSQIKEEGFVSCNYTNWTADGALASSESSVERRPAPLSGCATFPGVTDCWCKQDTVTARWFYCRSRLMEAEGLSGGDERGVD